MLKNCCITCIVLLLHGIKLFAQNEDVRVKIAASPDSFFIRSYDDYLHFTLTYNTHNILYRVTDNADAKFILSPNEIYETEISVSYSFIRLKYAFSPRFLDINNNENIKGRTSRNDFEIDLGINRFDVVFEHSDVTGFYLHNTSDFDAGWRPGQPYTLFPGLRDKQTGGSITYNCNKRFSYASLDGGTEQQLKTAFSVLPALYVYYFRMRDEDTAVEKGEDVYTKTWDIYFSIPAAANFVFAKNWYCAVNAGPGLGVDIISSELVDKSFNRVYQKQTFATIGYAARLSIGWCNRKYFAGVDGSVRRYAHISNGDDMMEKRFYNASIYVGTRFRPPGFVKRGMDWVKKILPVDL
jgi:hypothetical protein